MPLCPAGSGSNCGLLDGQDAQLLPNNPGDVGCTYWDAAVSCEEVPGFPGCYAFVETQCDYCCNSGQCVPEGGACPCLTPNHETLKCDDGNATTVNDTCFDSICEGCTPSCSGNTCGDDGCGGTCGTCSGQDACVAGSCVCQPACSGKVCGDDGCGGVCGTCASNETCEEGGEVCVCQPECTGKVCGDNGCGGVCGTCSGADTCVGGQCTAPCNTCPPEESWYQGEVVTDAVVGESLCTFDTTYIVCEAGPPGQCPTWSAVQDCMTLDDDFTCTQVDQNAGYHAECGFDQ